MTGFNLVDFFVLLLHIIGASDSQSAEIGLEIPL